MHFVKPESQQILDREAESAHRHAHHALTRWEPDHWEDPDEDYYDYADKEGHQDESILDADYHRATGRHIGGPAIHHGTHGLPVHDRYGARTIEHNPYQHEFVHGTNYELTQQHSAPVVEHNPHAFSRQQPQPSHTADVKKIAAPKEVFPAKETTSAKKAEPAPADKKK